MSNRDEMAGVNEKFMSLASLGNAALMAACYTEDAMLMFSNRDFIKGRQEIQKCWQGVLDSGVKTIKLETVELEERGDTAYEVGRYKMFGPEGKIVDAGKYVVIWKWDRGQWKYHRDISNSSMPQR